MTDILKQVFKVTDSLSKIALPEQMTTPDLQNKVEEISDQIDGGLTSSNMAETRCIVVFNDWGNLDGTYDFIMDFELDENMTKLVECKVSFKIRSFNVGVTI